MAASIVTSKATCHVRSISLPARLHPLTLNVEAHLDGLRSSQATSTSTYHKLSGLKDLYECIDELLQLSVAQRTLSNEQHCKSVDEVLDGSLRLLDVCGTTRDIFSQMKESLKELQSSLRRRKGRESGLSSEVEAYMASRKKLNKAISKCLRNLKCEKKNCTATLLDKESNAVAVIGMLREVEEISVSVFESLLSKVSLAKARSRPSGWSVVSKLFQAKPVSAEREVHTNEVEKIDAELLALKSSKDMNVVQVQNIMKTRATILNMVNH
ncbi:hypothetical protein P3X46_001948 [Hevea brasiliensis]|uniref:DUF241 domain-containing protein n=1 Tax=Hevea brasiliensis TaxID=3981 RepID=A0ABQ9N596_HEVBR|nr:hypothetical protein P3X46_001948 [Hevea brasiliensis]